MHNKCCFALFGVFLCFFLTFPVGVRADNNAVTVWGVVTNTEFGLVLNDGSRDFLLLGITDTEFEGKTCEVTGVAATSLGIETINVDHIEIIGDASSHNYSMLFRPGTIPGLHGAGTVLGTCPVTPGAAGPRLCRLRPFPTRSAA